MMMSNGQANDDALMQSAAKLWSGVAAGSKQVQARSSTKLKKRERERNTFFFCPFLAHPDLPLPMFYHQPLCHFAPPMIP
jgi:hypothetical protein